MVCVRNRTGSDLVPKNHEQQQSTKWKPLCKTSHDGLSLGSPVFACSFVIISSPNAKSFYYFWTSEMSLHDMAALVPIYSLFFLKKQPLALFIGLSLTGLPFFRNVAFWMESKAYTCHWNRFLPFVIYSFGTGDNHANSSSSPTWSRIIPPRMLHHLLSCPKMEESMERPSC